MVLSVVTGGTGFVGKRLVQSLVARGDKVRVLDIATPSQQVLEEWNSQTKISTGTTNKKVEDLVEFVQTDITNPEDVRKGVADATTVFHVASVVHTKQNQQDFVFKVNLGGTKNLIQACQHEESSVRKLVYVSSGGVVYQGENIENGDEKLPYAQHSRAPYVLSKIQAEQEVLRSASPKLATISLRPHVIFGPGDVRFLPAVIKNAQEGKLKFQIGRGTWMSDYTYVDNLIDACLLADEKLDDENAVDKISGQAYFITNGEPMPFWDFVRSILQKLNLPPMSATPIPHQPVLALAYLREWFDTYVRGGTIDAEDGFTPFAISYMCTHHYFSIDRARKEIGYEPKVSVAEGLERTCQAYMKEQHGKGITNNASVV